jgi:hypothetical protein
MPNHCLIVCALLAAKLSDSTPMLPRALYLLTVTTFYFLSAIMVCFRCLFQTEYFQNSTHFRDRFSLQNGH